LGNEAQSVGLVGQTSTPRWNVTAERSSGLSRSPAARLCRVDRRRDEASRVSKALGVRERPVLGRHLARRLPSEGSQCRRLHPHRSLVPRGEPRPCRRRRVSARKAHPGPSPVAGRERLSLPSRVARCIRKPRATPRNTIRRRASCSWSISPVRAATEHSPSVPQSPARYVTNARYSKRRRVDKLRPPLLPP